MSINFNDYKKNSFKSALRDFYSSLEKHNIHLEKDAEKKRVFFNLMRGRFLQILKMKNNVAITEIIQKLSIEKNEYIRIEEGKADLSDSMFFQICNLLGCNTETSTFLEKIEEAFKPEVKKARFEMAEALKNQFGIYFSDSDKYENQKKGEVININFSKRKKDEEE